ncbi:MAG: hypothetical protein IPK26_22770 [Planctomycetes bacterium]|nr:hypothetical protein [Planctomycetota bacterium]
MRTSPLLALLCTAAVAVAQTVTIPTNVLLADLDRPFPGGIGRYQQWYAQPPLLAGLGVPVRLERAEFFAGATQTSNTAALDMEVSMAHSFGSGMTGAFNLNYADSPVIVVPRRTINLAARAAGQVAIDLQFTNRFTWDGQRPIVIDIKIFGNGRPANAPFTYNFRGSQSAFGLIERAYQGGNANAASGQHQAAWGLLTRFSGRPGVNIDYGAGCAGSNFVVPRHAVVQIGSPGITWTHQLTQAASQRSCVWIMGESDTVSPLGQLPLDLGPVIGAFGCSLLANPFFTAFSTTVGGGAGAGSATMSIALPPVTNYVGMNIYTQWLVLDPGASNTMLSATQGVRSIIAPAGGG